MDAEPEPEGSVRNRLRTRYSGMTQVWKFGYGSNMSPTFLKVKKMVTPLAWEKCVVKGHALSFPEGAGFDFVEPAFATTRADPEAEIHGVATLFSIADAQNLNKQEGVPNGGSYNIELVTVTTYDGRVIEGVELYVPAKPRAQPYKEGVCSTRYRDILVNGAKEVGLDPAWIAKLEAQPTYTPSDDTLAKRAALPPPSALPAMTIADLALHNGKDAEKYPDRISSCGYIFQVKDFFNFAGRDITFRNILQARGINMDTNDDGGKSPFPRISQLEPSALEYALRYRDRYIHKAGDVGPVAVLKEFWEEQEAEVPGIFMANTLSKLRLDD